MRLLKPVMSPKSFDSDNGMNIFSREEDNFLFVKAEGDEDEFRFMDRALGDPSSSAYDQASLSAK